jgi:peptide/nickel transport system substrate-binding protein
MTKQTPRRVISRRTFVQGSVATGAVGVPLVVAACGGDDDGDDTGATAEASESQAAAGEPVRGGRLRVGFQDGGPDETLTPLSLPSFIGTARAQNLYDRLFQWDQDLNPQPQLALSVEPNDDATVWTINLREGVTWHDGSPFTANDVLYTFQYILDEETASEAVGKIQAVDLDNTTVIDDLTLEVGLTQPFGDFQNLMADKALFIVKEGTTDFTPDTLVGTGPFKLESFEPGTSTVMVRNEEYFLEGQPYLDELEFITIPDDAARLNALIGGQIDAMVFLNFAQAAQLVDNPDVELVRIAASTNTPITMRIDTPPFDDNRVRTAMKLAVDRPAMVEQVLLGFGAVGNDVFGFSYPSYNDELPQREYDPEEARRLLEEAGVTLPLQVTLPTSDAAAGMQESATLFKEQASAAGIEVTLEVIDTDSYFSNDLYLNAPLYQSSWGAAFELVASDAFTETGPYNETKWLRPEWEARYREAQGIADEDERNEAYKALQEEIWEEGGYIIWGFQELIDAAAPYVKGIVPNPQFNLGHFKFADVWLEN